MYVDEDEKPLRQISIYFTYLAYFSNLNLEGGTHDDVPIERPTPLVACLGPSGM